MGYKLGFNSIQTIYIRYRVIVTQISNVPQRRRLGTCASFYVYILLIHEQKIQRYFLSRDKLLSLIH